MKRLFPGAAALAAVVLLSSCGGRTKEGVQSLTNEIDSLSYCMGAMAGVMYWQTAEMDTTLNDIKVRESYFDGIEAAMTMQKEDAPNFHKGVRIGFEIDNSIREFEKETGVKLNREIVLSAARQVIFNREDANGAAVQAVMMMLDNRIRNRTQSKDSAGALAELQAYAAKNNMTKLSEDAYMIVMAPGSGSPIGPDERVALKSEFGTIRGSIPNVSGPAYYTPGATFADNESVEKALKDRLPGSVVVVAATAPTLVGPDFAKMGLQATDVVIVTFTFGDKAEKIPSAGK